MKRYKKVIALTLSAAMLAGCGFTNRRSDEAESTPSYIDTTTPTPTPPESVAESVTVPADTVGLADASIPDSSIAAAIEPTLEPTVVPQEPLVEDKMLDPNYEFADESQVHTDPAKLYTNRYANANGITVCVNAGHGTSGGDNYRTYCHPDHTAKVTGGSTAEGAIKATAIASGMEFADGTPERAVTLAEALLVRDELLRRGYNVLMIRETEDVQLDNIARTVLANNLADCHIAIHWDSTDFDKGAFYMSVPQYESYLSMYPVSETWQKSNALGDKLIAGLQANNVKIFESGSMEMDLTQTSYSKVPSIDIELGDRTSDHSDDSLAILCKGLCDGIDLYFAANPKNPQPATDAQQAIPAETESSAAGSQSTEAVPAEETTAD